MASTSLGAEKLETVLLCWANQFLGTSSSRMEDLRDGASHQCVLAHDCRIFAPV